MENTPFGGKYTLNWCDLHFPVPVGILQHDSDGLPILTLLKHMDNGKFTTVKISSNTIIDANTEIEVSENLNQYIVHGSPTIPRRHLPPAEEDTEKSRTIPRRHVASTSPKMRWSHGSSP
jgi:hypothetical protein